MKAWLLTGIGQMEVREVPEPAPPRGDEVLVRVRRVGVCGSDVHYYHEGRIGDQVIEFPFIIGHECAGTVEAAGPASGFAPGEEVAVEPAVSCLDCDQCRAGRLHTCRRLRFLGCPGQLAGCMAELLVMPARNLLRTRSVPLDLAALAEPLSIGIYAIRSTIADPAARVAILGAGPIGLSVLLAAQAAGVRDTFVTDPLAHRAALAARLGAGWSGSPAALDNVAAARAPRGLDAVIECCGEQDALDQAVRLLAPGGRLAIVGIPQGDRVSFPIHDLRRREITILNIRRQLDCLAPALELLRGPGARAAALITHTFPFDRAREAMEMVAEKRDGVIKALITLDDIGGK